MMKMSIKKWMGYALAFGLTSLSMGACALEQPTQLASDARIEVVPYSMNNVVPVHGTTFTTTQITFGQDEIIEDVQNGDLGAWTASVNADLPYMLFLKPTADGSDTNMTVVTNEHTYYFHLLSNVRCRNAENNSSSNNNDNSSSSYTKNNGNRNPADNAASNGANNTASSSGNSNNAVSTGSNNVNGNPLRNIPTGCNETATQPTYAVHFIYPDEEQASLQSAMGHARQLQALTKAFSNPHAYHWNYSTSGDKSIAPLHVFDDGQFTYMQFRPNQPIPAVFAVTSKSGAESVVNVRQQGVFLIVQQVAPQFTLRLGTQHVASLFNNGLIATVQSNPT